MKVLAYGILLPSGELFFDEVCIFHTKEDADEFMENSCFEGTVCPLGALQS